MNNLPNTILNFSDETRRNSYADIKEYFECYKAGKTAVVRSVRQSGKSILCTLLLIKCWRINDY